MGGVRDGAVILSFSFVENYRNAIVASGGGRALRSLINLMKPGKDKVSKGFDSTETIIMIVQKCL